MGVNGGHILCFKHRRRVARDNTVKYYRHTLQLLPTQQRRSYAGAVVVVLEGLDGRLSLQHEGRIIASQEAPPGPASLRSRNETSPTATIPTPDPELASKPSVAALELLSAKPDQEEGAHAAAIDDPDVPGCGSSHRRGGRRSCSRRDGRRCSRPSFRGCPFDGWRGSWESTETR